MRRILLTAITVFFFSVEFASAQIGIGTTTPNPAAQLDVYSNNRGLLMPRVPLVSDTSWSPLPSTPTDGMILYNTAAAGSGNYAVSPGFYYWANSMWVPIAQVPATAPTFQVTALNCQAATPATGTYEQNTPILAGASKTVTVTPNAAGAYSVSTNTVAGVSFSAAGTFTAAQAGTPQNILLLASGTPTSSGLKTFIVTAGAQVCTFNINFTAPAVFNCVGIVSTLTQAQLVSGNSYSGTVTLPYTAGNSNSYPANSLTSNGLTLASTAGTYLAGGGSIVYTLSGTYTGTGGAVSFTLPESGCVVYMGGATFNPNSLSCGNTPAGTYTINTPMAATNTKVVNITANTIGYYSASTNTVNGVSFSGSGFISILGNNNITLAATGTPAAAGTYNFTITLGGLSCTFPVTFTALATFNCANITTTFSASFVNGTAYSGTVTEPYTVGNNTGYGISTIGPIDGLTLTAPAGTYLPAGGSIVYTISGTFTGVTNSQEVFALPESGCSVTLGSATYAATSINCGGLLIGSYVAGYPMTAGNTKNISINVATPGGYAVNNTQNGVTFSGSGVFSTTGVQTITLTASGTPINAGGFNYTFTLGGQSCNTTISYTSALTTVCAGVTNTISTPLVSATSYTGTITEPYIAGSGLAYGNLIVGPSNGLTLTRVPGVYSPTGGNVIYNLSGTYTGGTNTSQAFTLAEGCPITLGQPHLIPGSLSCGGALTGIYQVGISSVGNTKVISFANIAAGTYSITTTSLSGISFTTNNLTLTSGGSQSIALVANGTPNTAGTFNFTITIDGQSCTFPVTILPAANVNCAGIINGLPQAPLVSGTAYTGTVTEPYTTGNGQAYGVTTLNSNGIILNRVAGTYAPGGGTVVYTIGGTYNSTLGYVTFTLPENNCLVSSGVATIGGNSLNCNSAPAGSYFVGVPMTTFNTKSVNFGVSTAGTGNATTNTVNGVSFAAATQGLGGNGISGLTMTATGTPLSTGTFNYTVTVLGQTCVFPITFTDPATFNCAGITNTLTGPLVNGTAYTGTITLPYTGGAGSTYAGGTLGPVNGLTLTNAGGIYSGGGGNIVYTISGTYTGGTNATVFTLPESGCSVTLGAATFTGGTLNCGGTLSGIYQNQVAATGANTKVMTVDVATPGSYNFTTTTSLGYTFSASGVFSTTGTQTVTLKASGTGNGSGTGSYTLNIGNQSCNFNVTVLATLVVNCSAITHTLPSSLANGSAYSGTVNVPYTGILSGSYPSALLTSNGLTLTRTAGTYSSSGTIVYNLSGTFTGTTGTSVNFTLLESNCVVTAGAANYGVASINCNGLLSGNYVQNFVMTAANTKAITITVTNPGPWAVNTGAVNGVTFSGSGLFGGTGTQTALITAAGTPSSIGVFSYPVTLAGQSCNFNVTYGVVSANCAGTVNTMPTYLVNGTTYNTGSVSIPFTSGNGAAYGVTTVGPNSGLTLTRVAGTYDAGGGTVVYNLSGVYSGAAGATVNFVLTEGCTVTAGSSSFNSPDCSGALAGIYQAGLTQTAGNTKMIDLNFSAPGFYSINVGGNGINFGGTGFVTTPGIHTVTLTGNGTPTNQGTTIFTLNLGTQSCSFPVTFAPAATFNCGAITGFPLYQPITNTTYSATVTEPYTLGNGSAYGTTTVSSSGLNLVRTGGTFAGTSGNVVYTLSGTLLGTAVFTLPESGCILTIGTIQYNNPPVACGGILAGTYTAGTVMNSSNTKTVTVNVSVPGVISLATGTANGVTFAASATTSTLGLQDVVLTASGTPVASGTYYYTISLNGLPCSFGVTYQ